MQWCRSFWDSRTSIHESVKLLVFSGVIVLVIVYVNVIADEIQAIAKFISTVPLYVTLPSIFLLMFLRRVIPIFWYLFPAFAGIFLYLLLTFGKLKAVVTFQALKLVCDLISIWVIHYLYNGPINRFLAAPDTDDPILSLLPGFVLKVLRTIDAHWHKRLTLQLPWQTFLTTIAFGSCWSMDEEVMIYWFSTRAPISKKLLSLAISCCSILDIPIMLVRAHVYVMTVETVKDSGSFSIAIWMRDFASVAWYIVFLMILVGAPSTFYVHGENILLFYREIRESMRTQPNTAPADETARQEYTESQRRREDRKAQLLEQQVLEISWSATTPLQSLDAPSPTSPTDA